jgi:hypothetical protein
LIYKSILQIKKLLFISIIKTLLHHWCYSNHASVVVLILLAIANLFPPPSTQITVGAFFFEFKKYASKNIWYHIMVVE